MNNFIRWFKAFYRIDLDLVCELSRGKGLYNDYHDYPDTLEKYPSHFYTLECERCSKKFRI